MSMSKGDIVFHKENSLGEFSETKMNPINGAAIPGFMSLVTAKAITLVGTWTTSAITAGQRSLQTLDLGIIGNPAYALLGIYPTSIADADIPKVLPGYISAIYWAANNGASVDVLPNNASGALMLVSEDYTKTTRMTIPLAEKYGAGSGTAMPALGRTYTDFGVGVLVGWYSTASSGVMGINKKVQIESMWLTQSTTHTILNVAFFNTDVADSNTVSVKIAVII